MCDMSYEESDNSGIMLMRLMKKLGVGRIYVAGFDGFSRDIRSNYCADSMINSVGPENVSAKNRSISAQAEQLKKELAIVSITPSCYF